MKLKSVLDSVAEIFAGLKFGGNRDLKLGALDRGILEVSLMVSAMDGTIRPEEFTCFCNLAKQCRGYTQEGTHELLDRALRKAGYLMAMAQTGAYDEAARIQAFIELADDALPAGFTEGKVEDVRRAFVLWTAMGISDGCFCEIERRTIERLRDHFAAVKSDLLTTAELSSISLYHGFYLQNDSVRPKVIELLEPDFFVQAEAIMRAMKDPALHEKAVADLAVFLSRGTQA